MAKVTGEKAAATAAQLRQKAEEKDWTKEREYLGRTQKNLQGCVHTLSIHCSHNWPVAPWEICRSMRGSIEGGEQGL